MYFPRNLLLRSLALAPFLSYAIQITTPATEFAKVTIGQPLDIEWTDASGDVDLTLLFTGQKLSVAAGLKTSPYSWTPAKNLSNALYQISLKDSSNAADFSNPFTIQGTKASRNDDGVPDENRLNVTNSSPLLRLFGEESDDEDDSWAFDFSSLSQGTIIGIALAGALDMAIIVVLLVCVWHFRKKYLDAMRRYGDLLREVYGDDGPPRDGSMKILTPIMEGDEYDEEAEREKMERQRKIDEHAARVWKPDMVADEKVSVEPYKNVEPQSNVDVPDSVAEQLQMWKKSDNVTDTDNVETSKTNDTKVHDSVSEQIEEWEKDGDITNVTDRGDADLFGNAWSRMGPEKHDGAKLV